MISNRRDFDGKLREIYLSQLQSSKKREMRPPVYTQGEFIAWGLNQLNYGGLYRQWVESNYSKDLAPSADRLDDSKPYTFDNIEMVDWKTNSLKNSLQRKRGDKGKQAKRVALLKEDGAISKVYFSKKIASVDLNVNQANLGQVCRGLAHSCGGYKFKYISEEEYHEHK